MNSENQNTILKHANKQEGKITTHEAIELLGGKYYHNGAKYVGEILSRMVKNGQLIRVKKGYYEIPSNHNKEIQKKWNPINNSENQTKLF